ncbi:BgTH12-04982 [Blumeria graminis f. sp. triticale]|uniref:BgTH12-04982 n=1 Tax=Blumeria graminis f. sp. triticale TaxID=1689686 RepID=A0A9W4D0L4_BLUGR|nr:BgTH12-04982 [Blumeria graminis f. sp. triticale]
MKLYLSKLLTLALFLVEPAAAAWSYDCKRISFAESDVEKAIALAVENGVPMVEVKNLRRQSRYRVFLESISGSPGVSS